ncbi:peptide chain release factor N(5)-glutamine methyltransferase [Sphingomonas sp.]|uniref:peptide chain release factor N(5)-glutamine methyltransferase n=1 Tax=Sphingomonas sp. TaxID=28214 RepID=UPI0018399FA8|nr:peptide chain release factor N(5)-glutamine methyltransferase [Sphingomonas sp.]MBA3512272.1 peptide chain release factor N(5)-glutamine methyltransferase [Sphingomonas sp.]
MSGISSALADAARRVVPVSDTPLLDAELLLAHALGVDREQLLLDPPDDIPQGFESLVARREHGEPVAYIVGRRAFWTLELEVAPGVLVPRPDSETLLDSAVAHFEGSAGPKRILDLGTGSGALLLAALDQWRQSSGLGVDSSPAALAIAQRNATRLGLADRAEFQIGDWGHGIDERFDLILCNPPYVAVTGELGPGVAEHEPHEALFAGDDGLEALRALAAQFPRLLGQGGLAAVEIGFEQAASAASLLARDGLSARLARDLAGRPRALLLTWV